MKQFGVILCLALCGLATAKPGYKYPVAAPAPQSVRQSHVSSQSSSGIYSVVPSAPIAQFSQSAHAAVQQQPLPAPAPQHQASFAAPHNTNLAPQQQQQIFQQQVQQPQQQIFQQQVQQPQQQIFQQQLQQPQQQIFTQTLAQQGYQNVQPQQQVIISKDIYIHSAPEDQDIEQISEQQLEPTAPIRKNYRIVFIKAPSPNLKFTTAAIRSQRPQNEEKTVIYVLSKRPDLTEVQQQLQQVQTEQKAHKPEVYFIKYKTQEEAQRAQQEIQAQYDALGGSTHISDEGIAPLRSVIGSVGNGLNNGFSGSSNSGSFGSVNLGNSLNNGFNTASNSGSFGSASQQSFVQGNFDQSSSSNSFVSLPTQKYLPGKTKK